MINLKQGFNPYLPSWEYIPDGEPHVFGDRLYVYGSHDRFNGHSFCLNDYVCWSAPVTDLRDWRYEGVIYGRCDDPRNADGMQCLYAPDVTQGADGRFYLYYVLDRELVVSVAVSDTPAGRYSFLGYVRYPDGTLLGRREGDEPNFDPGVLFENGRTYLYTGHCARGEKERHGPMVTVLGEDMLTVAEKPRFIAPSEPYSVGSGFEGHEFFEASSIRKVGDTYYFIYSSVRMHELCYATSKSPTEGFQYRGTIVSNVDVGIGDYKPSEKPMAYPDNNHGSLVEVNGRWYVFYHRHTNRNSFSRQGCMEPIVILPDGAIPQVTITSCGPNGGPLAGEGEYPAYIACNLLCDFDPQDSIGYGVLGAFMDARYPFITQDGADGDENPGYAANLADGAMAGFKYFDCAGTSLTELAVRGWCRGRIEVLTSWDGEPLGSIPVSVSNEWKRYRGCIPIPDGVRSIYLRFKGWGRANLLSFTLEKQK